MAKDEAAKVKDTAVNAGADVAQTAKAEASKVVTEAATQAKDLLSQLRSEVRDQGGVQQQRLAGTLHGLAAELGGMAAKSDQDGAVTDLAHRASRKGGEIAHWLENHEPEDLLDEVKSFARRRPVAFLAIAAAAGVVAGRVARGAVATNTSLDSPSEDGTGGPGQTYAGQTYAGQNYAGQNDAGQTYAGTYGHTPAAAAGRMSRATSPPGRARTARVSPPGSTAARTTPIRHGVGEISPDE